MTHFIQVLTLALSWIYLASGKGNISGDLTFDCAQNGSMIIFMKSAELYGSIYAVGTTKGSATKMMCSTDKHKDGQSFIFEIKGCDIKKPVKVIFTHENQTGSSQETIVGGKNISFYELTCNEVPLGGYSINKTVTLNETDEVQYTHVSEPTFKLNMDIYDNHRTVLNQPVLIGTELHLVISGSVGFGFHADICVASDSSHNHSITLLRNGSTTDFYILSNFMNTSYTTSDPSVSSTSAPTHSIEATLYAFHFASSSDVSIVCNITVCQNDDNTCSLTTTSANPTQRRRRRDVTDFPRTRSLRTNLRVVDTFGDTKSDINASGAFRRPAFWLSVVILVESVIRILM